MLDLFRLMLLAFRTWRVVSKLSQKTKADRQDMAAQLHATALMFELQPHMSIHTTVVMPGGAGASLGLVLQHHVGRMAQLLDLGSEGLSKPTEKPYGINTPMTNGPVS